MSNAYPVPPLPPSWDALRPVTAGVEFRDLARILASEATAAAVHPPANQVFRALELTPLPRVRVVILGQDPYHGPGQAEGLAFSVPQGVPPPPSLRNILRELSADVGVPHPGHGSLAAWAERGVLLLNTVLTVREREAHSHARLGWETFTDAVVRLGAATASAQLREWDWPVPEELLVIGDNGGGEVFGVWVVPGARRAPLVQMGSPTEEADLAVLGTTLGGFLAAWTAFYLPLAGEGDPAVDRCLHELDVPAHLRSGDSEEHLWALLAWASPDLPDPQPDPYERPQVPHEITRLAQGG